MFFYGQNILQNKKCCAKFKTAVGLSNGRRRICGELFGFGA